jgi:hypothetical protein
VLQEYLGFCIVVPAFIGLVGTLLAGRLRPPLQHPVAAGVVLFALLLGSFLLLGKYIHNPERHWHWLPAIGLFAGICGGIFFRQGSSPGERLIGSLAIGALTGWLLVPTWKDLADQRWLIISGLGVGTTLLVLLTDWLGRSARPLFILFCFGLTAFAGAAWIGAGFSLTNARWLLILGSTTAGIFLASMLPVWMPRFNAGSLIPLLCSWLAGSLFIGAIEPNPPRYDILLLALLPLALLATANWLRKVLHRPADQVPDAKM